MTFSLVTNACASDAARLRLVVPSWQRTFGEGFDELLVVLDTRPPSGRIAALHGPLPAAALEEVRDTLADLARADRRIRIDVLDDAALAATAARWFLRGRPLRCQAGTPILAFARAFDVARVDRVVLRADCDMVFHEAGWLTEAIRRLEAGALDLAEPSHLEEPPDPHYPVSTRALLLDRRRFDARCLPMRAHRTDPLRRLLRRWEGRPPWLALEQMLAVEMRAGRLRHALLAGALGGSMHIATRAEAELPGMPEVVAAFERGEVPARQREAGWNFERTAWAATSDEVPAPRTSAR